jgi:hypothetical protein
MPDREPTVINTGGGNTGWIVAIILALIVIGALLLFTGVIDLGGGGSGTDVDVNVPAVETPSTDKPATDTPATSTPATGTPDTGTPATGGTTPQQ